MFEYEIQSLFDIILMVIQMDGILFVNKPQGMTSHDVVFKLRKILQTKKIGHTGTLDPDATGVLMILIGKSTKILPFIKNSTKEYVAELSFGYSSNTGDIWGNLEEHPITYPTLTELDEVLKSFVGKQKQIPPMVSAIKVNGKKLYEYERAGIEVEVKPRDVEIFELELLSYDKVIEFRALCSSGTYIRSLCVDIANKLNQKGVLSNLVRTKIDQYVLKDCFTLEQIQNGDFKLFTNHEVLSTYKYFEFDDITDVLVGKRVELDCNEEIVMITHKNEVVAAYEHVENGIYKSKRGLW